MLLKTGLRVGTLSNQIGAMIRCNNPSVDFAVMFDRSCFFVNFKTEEKNFSYNVN